MLDSLALKALYTILTFIFVLAFIITLYSFRQGVIDFVIKVIDNIKTALNFLFGLFYIKDDPITGNEKGIFREWPFKTIFMLGGIVLVGVFIYLNESGQLNTNAKFLSYVIGLLVLMLVSYLLYDNTLNAVDGEQYKKYNKDGGILSKLKFPFMDRLKPLFMNYGVGILLFLAVYSIIITIIYSIDPRSFNAAKIVNLFIAITLISGLYFYLKRFLPVLGSFGKLLMYTIFIIPCLIHSVIKIMIRNEIKEKGNMMRNVVILCVAIILGAGYIFIPHLVKYFHSLNDIDPARKNNIDMEIETLEHETMLLRAKKNRIEAKPHKYIDWEFISNGKDQFYKTEKKELLKKELEKIGYIDMNKDPAKYAKEKKNNDLLGITTFTLSDIVRYVQESVPKIFKINSRIDENIQRVKELKVEKSELGTTNKAKVLLMKPMPLDKEIRLAQGYELNKATNVYPNLNYAISSWVYLHPEPPNHNAAMSEYTNILQYGEAQKISYNMRKQSLKVTTFDRETNNWIDVFETKKIKLQKWNNIILNVHNSTIDIFINGDLVISKINHVPILNGQYLVSGENNGISGGIANVVFYPSPLKKFKIDLLYNDLKNKSPPVV